MDGWTNGPSDRPNKQLYVMNESEHSFSILSRTGLS